MENNVQVSQKLLEAMRDAAQTAGKDVNGLFEEAAERLLAHRQVDNLAKRGESHARRVGREPSDIVGLVREIRSR